MAMLLGASVDLGLSLSVSADLGLGVGIHTGPAGLEVSGSATLGLRAGAGAGATGATGGLSVGLPGLGLGGGRGGVTASSSPIATTGVVGRSGQITTILPVTTVETTHTVTCCMTGLGGILTCGRTRIH